MGFLAVGTDKVQDELPFFKTALKVNSNIDPYWLSYIDKLIKLGRPTGFDQPDIKSANSGAFNSLSKRPTKKD